MYLILRWWMYNQLSIGQPLIIPGHQQVPLSLEVKSKQKKKGKKSRRLKFVNMRFSVSIKNSSGISAVVKLNVTTNKY